MNYRSKGIALIRSDKWDNPHLEYVFNVVETYLVQGEKMPYLLEMTAEKLGAVTEALERQYGPTEKTNTG